MMEAALPLPRLRSWPALLLGGLPALFLLLDAGMKLVKPAFIVEASAKAGIPEAAIVPLGALLALCTVLYLMPRTAVLGAVLLTGYLGGAVCAHVLLQDGLFNLIFPVLLGVMLWSSLLLREPRLRTLVLG